jgi:hypothetical protein
MQELIPLLNRFQDCNEYELSSGCFIILFAAILRLHKFGAVALGILQEGLTWEELLQLRILC